MPRRDKGFHSLLFIVGTFKLFPGITVVLSLETKRVSRGKISIVRNRAYKRKHWLQSEKD